MEVGQLNIAADQVAPERQAAGKPANKLSLSDNERAGTKTESLGGALASKGIPDVLAEPNELRLSVDDELKQVVAKVVNRDTGEVVREIPPEDILGAAKVLKAILGQMLDREV